MYRFLLFLKKSSFVLLFVAIEAVAFHFYTGSSDYTRAKMIAVSNQSLLGDVKSTFSKAREYFLLRSENRRLVDEVAGLRTRLASYRALPPDSVRATAAGPYDFLAARVVNNSLLYAENFITIDRGTRDGVVPDMGLLSGGNIVGYIVECSERYSVAISVLNAKFRTGGKILGTDYFGSLYWDGRSYSEMILSEIPKYAPIAAGDTIVTTDYSSIFPSDLGVGTVKDFELVNGTYYDARITLFADMGALNRVVLVRNRDHDERRELETRVDGDRTNPVNP